MSSTHLTVITADLSDPDHQTATLDLLQGYSMDPMADAAPLSETARRELIPGLRAHPTTLVFLAYRDTEPVGLAVCFRGFSTFAARPLLNVHDFFVAPAHRRTGISRMLFEAIEDRARELGCCKLTLEVLENNHRARRVYKAAGFTPPAYGSAIGASIFLAKRL